MNMLRKWMRRAGLRVALLVAEFRPGLALRMAGLRPMAGGSGETTTGTLTDSLPTVIADARIVREYEGVYLRTCDVRNLDDGTGLNWNEISLGQLQAQDITETTRNENAQQLADTIFSVQPLMTQILVKITDRTYRRIASVVKGKIGQLAGNAMARKKDEDYLALFSTFNGAADPGAGNALAHGYITAAARRITSNTTEPATSAIFTVLHGFQIYDIERQIVPGSSTLAHALTDQLGEEVWRQGLRGMIAGTMLFEDGNIVIDANDDATGAVHAKEAVVCVNGMGIKEEHRRDPSFGGGADEVFLTDEYG